MPKASWFSLAKREKLRSPASAWRKGLRAVRGMELLAVLLLLWSAMGVAVPMFHGMATQSIWLDEIASIENHSSKSVWDVVTRFGTTNNHVFLNALNAASPWFEGDLTTRVRVWSFVAVLLCLGMVGWFFVRRGLWLEGGLLCWFLLQHERLLQQNLQARGYGLSFLATMVVGLAVWAYFERQEKQPLKSGAKGLSWKGWKGWEGWREVGWKGFLLVTMATMLGCYALIPSIFLTGMLIIALWVVARDVRWFAVGGVAGVGVLLLFSPMLGEIYRENERTKEEWQGQFADVEAVSESLRRYLFDDALIPSSVIFALCGLAILCWAVARKIQGSDYRLTAGVVYVLGTCGLYGIAFYLSTMFVRTTSVVVIPLGLFVLGMFSLVYRSLLKKYPRWAGGSAMVLVLILSVLTWKKGKHYVFVPKENWAQGSAFIKANFPDDVLVYCPYRGGELQMFLEGKNVSVATNQKTTEDWPVKGVEDFRDGRLLIYETGANAEDRVNFIDQLGRRASVSFTQKRGAAFGGQVLSFALPEATGIASLKIAGKEASRSAGLEALRDGSADSYWVSKHSQPRLDEIVMTGRFSEVLSGDDECELVCFSSRGRLPGKVRVWMVAGEERVEVEPTLHTKHFLRVGVPRGREWEGFEVEMMRDAGREKQVEISEVFVRR